MAQQPKSLIALVNKRLKVINDYSADIKIDFNIPSVNIQTISGKVFYKKPDKFRVRTHGIVFLPKQNPFYALMVLSDTNAYMAIINGEEKIGLSNCKIVSIIPNKDGDLILGKFWVDDKTDLVIRSQLTTKSNGTIQVDNTYGADKSSPLPVKTLFTVDITKFKVPKALAVDINAKSSSNTNYNAKSSGYITLFFSNYKINQKLPDTVFTDPDK